MSLSHDQVNVIYEDRAGVIWIGTLNGLNKFDRESNRFIRYHHNPLKPNSLSYNEIGAIFEDRSGVLWIGTEEGGLNRFHRESDTFTVYQHDEDDPKSVSSDEVWAIVEDRDDTLWIGTNEGLNQFDRTTEQFFCYEADPETPDSLSHNTIWTIHEDAAGVLWLGTSAGLNKFEREKEVFTHYTEQDGLPHDVIYGILEDDAGFLWISTGKGLSRFDPKTETFKNYGINELQNITFMEGAYHKSRSGEMFFGGMQGFNAFYPQKIQDNPHRPPVVITDFAIFNRSVPLGKGEDGRVFLEKPITYIQVFRHEQRELLLNVAYNITTQHHNSANITTAVDRASKIVFALKSYARYDESGEMISTHIPDNIDVVLTLYQNQLKHGIELITHYEDVPAIPCYPDDLTQVWTNLIHNAIQAMEGKGRLEIMVTRHPPAPLKGGMSETGRDNSPLEGGRGVSSFILAKITDSGPGIPDEIQEKIFDPFFTTKPPGEGSGLGLNIVQKIIDRHQGRIQVESQPGETTFSVFLPVP